MKKLNITPGEWKASVIRFGKIYTGEDEIHLPDNEYAEHNARLIADAGNTYQQCGLLPSELLKQRDELLDVLREIRLNALGHDNPVIKMLGGIASEAIKNAE
jgi:hypothetical protein